MTTNPRFQQVQPIEEPDDLPGSALGQLRRAVLVPGMRRPASTSGIAGLVMVWDSTR